MSGNKLAYYLVAVVLLAAAGGVYLYTRPQQEYSLTHIEKALTPAEHAQGLSGRTDVPADYGMLFVFEKADDYAFWMKDMLVPIDIIWLSDTGAIVGIEHSVATSTFPHSFDPPVPVRYVLETKAGNADAHGWETGTQLALPIP